MSRRVRGRRGAEPGDVDAGSGRVPGGAGAWSRDDYYAGRGESPGTWYGSAAAALGLRGTVAPGSLERLIDGCHPATEERLRQPMRERTIHVPSLDPDTGERIMVE